MTASTKSITEEPELSGSEEEQISLETKIDGVTKDLKEIKSMLLLIFKDQLPK